MARGGRRCVIGAMAVVVVVAATAATFVGSFAMRYHEMSTPFSTFFASSSPLLFCFRHVCCFPFHPSRSRSFRWDRPTLFHVVLSSSASRMVVVRPPS